jgi:predicted Zn finger-like uncharacterized protein
MPSDTARSFIIGTPNAQDSSPMSSGGLNKKRVSVVQCPACQTKFAVDSSAITAVSNPRFHCSRCDHVFSVSAIAEGGAPFQDLQQPEQIQEPPQPQITKPAVNPSTLDFFENATQASVFGVDDTGEDFSASVMNEEPIDSSELPDDVFDYSSDLENSKQQIGDHLFDFGLTGAKSLEEEPMGYGSLTRAESSPIPKIETTDNSIDPLLKKAVVKAPPSYKLLLAPSFASIILFGAIAIISMVSPKTITNLSNGFIAAKEHTLPTDLYVKKASLKRVVLDSGETVSVITGKVKNDSSLAIKELFLEAAIFDPKSKLLEKRKAHVASALTKSRVQSLTPQMLEDLQNAKPARSFNLKPNQEGDFTIVVPEPQAINSLPPTSFVTRIYSGRVDLR